MSRPTHLEIGGIRNHINSCRSITFDNTTALTNDMTSHGRHNASSVYLASDEVINDDRDEDAIDVLALDGQEIDRDKGENSGLHTWQHAKVGTADTQLAAVSPGQQELFACHLRRKTEVRRPALDEQDAKSATSRQLRCSAARGLTQAELQEVRARINLRERRRMRNLNSAMEALRQVMPGAKGPSVRKLSKVATLTMARTYIRSLCKALAEMNQLLEGIYRSGNSLQRPPGGERLAFPLAPHFFSPSHHHFHPGSWLTMSSPNDINASPTRRLESYPPASRAPENQAALTGPAHAYHPVTYTATDVQHAVTASLIPNEPVFLFCCCNRPQWSDAS